MGAKQTVILSDGREVTVDVSTLTQREFRNFFNPATPDADGDKVVSRLTGLKTKEIGDLLRDDYRRVMAAVIDLSNRPLADPNSPSGSTSD